MTVTFCNNKQTKVQAAFLVSSDALHKTKQPGQPSLPEENKPLEQIKAAWITADKKLQYDTLISTTFFLLLLLFSVGNKSLGHI